MGARASFHPEIRFSRNGNAHHEQFQEAPLYNLMDLEWHDSAIILVETESI
jgi:hypothetical protein